MSDCFFCAIGDCSAGVPLIAESDRAVAFMDINPIAPTHALVIPREHYPNAGAMAVADPALTGEVIALAARVAQQTGIDGDGYRLIANTGANAGQSVFHVHFHVVGGRQLGWRAEEA